MVNRKRFMVLWIEEKIEELERMLLRERNHRKKNRIMSELAFFKGWLV